MAVLFKFHGTRQWHTATSLACISQFGHNISELHSWMKRLVMRPSMSSLVCRCVLKIFPVILLHATSWEYLRIWKVTRSIKIASSVPIGFWCNLLPGGKAKATLRHDAGNFAGLTWCILQPSNSKDVDVDMTISLDVDLVRFSTWKISLLCFTCFFGLASVSMQLKQMLSFGQSHPGRKGGKAGVFACGCTLDNIRVPREPRRFYIFVN